MGSSAVRDLEDKLERAYSLLKVPTLALWSARFMAKLGRLVDASERYLQATRLQVSEGDTELQEQAIAAARQERAQLLPRIPKLTILLMPDLPQDGLVTAALAAPSPNTTRSIPAIAGAPSRRLVLFGRRGSTTAAWAVIPAYWPFVRCRGRGRPTQTNTHRKAPIGHLSQGG